MVDMFRTKEVCKFRTIDVTHQSIHIVFNIIIIFHRLIITELAYYAPNNVRLVITNIT